MPAWQLTTPKSVERANTILAAERSRMDAEGVPGELLLTGGSSIAGLVTKGDIDLHLRVAESDFPVAVSRLRRLYTAALPEIWTASFAVFERSALPPVGVAVTVIGSEHDQRFVRSWEQLRSRAGAREQYNVLKRTSDDVEAAKSAFFDDLAGES
ncbi:GrpB family protein [Arthrobacter sp. TMN-37]